MKQNNPKKKINPGVKGKKADAPSFNSQTGSKAPGKAAASRTASGKSAAGKAPKDEYLWSMSLAPKIDQSTSGVQMAIAAFFTAFIILFVRACTYTRPMEQFYWSTGASQLTDFFSYIKMVLILICGGLVLFVLLYRLCTQSLALKRSFIYIPAAVYCLFVLLSYAFCDYKEFSLLGYNDRFEGTLVLIAYMLLLVFIVNSVNTQKNVKWILYPVAASSVALSLIGLSQFFGFDFFRTTLGKMLILPPSAWDSMDSLEFTFQHNEIYQTVYNINYVSFYLTLLVPLVGMLFIHAFLQRKEEPLWKPVLWAVIFALLVFNLIGSESSGGLLGMAAAVLAALIILNKRLIAWVKPAAILVVIAILIFTCTSGRWLPEFTGAVNSVAGNQPAAAEETPSPQSEGENTVEPGSLRPTIDYFDTTGENLIMSVNGNVLKIAVTLDEVSETPSSFYLYDEKDQPISMHVIENPTRGNFSLQDERFEDYVTVSLAQIEGEFYVIVQTEDMQWPFLVNEAGVIYRNQLGKTVELDNVPHMGWENNPGFGSGRGYIWSRTLPMMADTFLLGNGADTYCLYFPHNDYAGKYNTDMYAINTIVDKPHNMYMGAWTGTGGISLLALLALYIMYLVQSYRLYFRSAFTGSKSFLQYAGAGICFGITGFLAAGLVNDSSVSVMPMFYGLLGTGIAINLILKRTAEEGVQAKPQRSPAAGAETEEDKKGKMQ